MNQDSNNPFASPDHVDAPQKVHVSVVLRLLSLTSFASGFVAFMGVYGYPSEMNQAWVFGVLPILAGLACITGMAAVAGPWQPTTTTKWSWVTIGLGILFPLICLGLAAVLDATTKYGVHTYWPRIVVFFVAATTFWILSEGIHGQNRGRRLASVGFGFGVLQCLTSIVHFLYTEFDFSP